MNNTDWVEDIERMCETGREQSALVRAVRAIENMKANGEMERLDADIERVRMSALSVLLLVAVMRLTFSARQALPVWERRLEDSARELERRGQNAGKLLRGLGGRGQECEAASVLQ